MQPFPVIFYGRKWKYYYLSTFIHLNMHMDGAWDTFWIKSQNGTFLGLQKKSFGQKKILNSMHGLESAILAILPEIGRLAGLACPLSAALHFRP